MESSTGNNSKLKKRLEEDNREDIGKGHSFEDDINKKSDEIGNKRKNAAKTNHIRKG